MPLTTVSQGLLSTDAQYTGFKNRIINGDMTVDQRNAGASVTVPNDSNFYTTDRWQIVEDTNCVLSAQQITDAPTGFQNSLRVTVTTAATSIGTAAIGIVEQRIEGFNTADLAFGTASASTITLSFWIKSSLTGNFSGSLRNSAGNRSYPFSYTINSANTWEYKTVTVPGETTGTWVTNSGIGMRVTFAIGSGSNRLGTANAWSTSSLDGVTGSTPLVSTLNATWQLTGVQLEKGSVATSFDVLPYGTELALCQRYCEVVKPTGATNYANIGIGQCISTTGASTVYFYQTAKRAQPTVTYSAANTFSVTSSTGPDIVCTTVNTDRSDVTALAINIVVASGLVAGNATRLLQNNTAIPQITISAEL